MRSPDVGLKRALAVGLTLLFSGLTGCAHQSNLAGTTVSDTSDNRALLEVIEQYRLRLIEKNVEGLLVLASERYFEDSGTPTAEDDYGYDGLKYVLSKSLARLKSVRYDVQYRSVRVEGSRAEVEVYLSGAFELIAESGDRYRRVGDYHRFVLEKNGKEKWKFLSGM
jgi:hypothetical protein